MKFLKSYRRALVAVVLFVTLVGGVSAAASKTSPSDQVTVTIMSSPEHGEIYLNGKFVGSTTLSRTLSPGEHNIEVRWPGFETWSRELTVTPGNPTRVVALLQRPPK